MAATRRVLITGGTGFIGRATLPELAAPGRELHIVGRGAADGLASIATVHRADLLEAGQPQRLIERVRPHELVHLAWHLEPGQVWEAPENERWRRASLELVRAFGEAGGERAVLAGTVSEYGESADGICRESDPAAPDNLYGRSKALLGAEALEVCAGLGVSAAWARIFFAYGPHEHPARLVSSVAISLLRGERARCSHGRQVRDYLYTRDIGAALARLLDSDLGGVINVGSGTVIELRELVALVAEAAGNPELVEFGAIPPGPAQAPRIEADVTRLRDELGFEPAYDHETGVRETVDWWRARLMAPATAPANA